LKGLGNLELKREKKFNQIILATKNSGKVREFQKYFLNLNIKILKIDDVLKNIVEPEETGLTFEENARIKASYYSEKTELPVISEDSGLVIDSLGGYPGIYSSRIGKSDEERISIILKKLEDKEESERRACFVSVIALAQRGKIIKTFSGKVCGIIAEKPCGDNGFGYDPIFYYKPIKKTFAEVSPDIKNKYSHRGRAIKKLIDYLKKIQE